MALRPPTICTFLLCFFLVALAWGGEARAQGGQGGVGVYLDYDPPGSGNIVVFSVTYKSPADKAKVKRGDQLIKVDGNEVTGKPMNQVAAMIVGPPGTTVNMTFLRGGVPREVPLVRKVLKAKTPVSLPPPSQAGTGDQVSGGTDPYMLSDLEKHLVKQKIKKLTTEQQRQKMLQLLTSLKEKKITAHQLLETMKAEFP